MFHRGFIGGIDFHRIMSAAQELMNLIVGHVVDHLEQLRILAEKMLSGIAAGLHGVFLIIAVDGLFHALEQKPFIVLGEQRVPVRAPDYFNDVPTGAAKQRFEFLNYFAIAAHRSVEALEIAVNHPDQIVEIFPRCQS